MLLLLLFLLNLLKDCYNYTIFNKLYVFKLIKNYYLKKYIHFSLWKNSIFSIFLLNIYFKQYFVIFNISILLLNLLGYSFFYEQFYDILFSKNIDLTDPVYKDLEPSFNITDPQLTSKLPSEMTHNKIQKDENFYIFIFLYVSIYFIINLNNAK